MPSLPLVPRQPPLAPLNVEALQALADLQRQQKTTKRLTHHLTQAAQQLEAVAAQLNDRGVRHEAEYRKKRKRLESQDEQGEGEETEHEKADYEEFQSQVKELTKKLDNGVRRIVDDQVWADGLSETMREIGRKVERSTTQAAASQRQTQTRPQSQRVNGEEKEEEEEDDDDEDDQAATTTNTAYPLAPTAEETPSLLLKTLLSEQSTTWSTKSLTERYSQHNTYIGFYRMLHDSRDPEGNGPPIPHHSLWFANEEDVNLSSTLGGTQRSRRQDTNDEDEGSDIEIAREKISIKCPITFLPFTQPLTSTKCPHSFDKPAIDSLLSRTQSSLPLTDAQTDELASISDTRARNRRAAQLRIPAIPCPVCSVLLAEADLRPDPVLKRRVERILAAERREREGESDVDVDSDEDEDGDVVRRGTQRKPVGVGSSPPRGGEGKRKSAMQIKRERARSKSRGLSVVPTTQLGGGEGEGESEDE